ncbi:MAG: hypothetical protein M1834_001469 [Cirrosporium novae-zelandiae]|nr:MAG: hypothetical protein M1834_008625 [Cirrosporium novae-zelandiae]KAI9736003.1 MAG: hypothetical protein M1834_001469 [Cirrosporium novae-zelandiae]
MAPPTSASTLPPMAPIPPSSLRKVLVVPEWSSCLDAWITLAEMTLHSPPPSASFSDSQIRFLKSYFHELSQAVSDDVLLAGEQAVKLKKVVFIMMKMFLELDKPPPELLEARVLADICIGYPQSAALQRLLQGIWTRERAVIQPSLEKMKAQVISQASSKNPTNSMELKELLRCLTFFMKVVPGVGVVLMTGSDYLDSLSDLYNPEYHIATMIELRKMIVANVYLALTSLARGTTPNYSMLFDHIFDLKAQAANKQSKQLLRDSLLSDLVSSTPLLSMLQTSIPASSKTRAESLAKSLHAYNISAPLHQKRTQRKSHRTDKGKGRAIDITNTSDADDDIYSVESISQVQDLFPDLGSLFIKNLLAAYNGSVEQVTAHLLDNDIPEHLQHLDRSTNLPLPASFRRPSIPREPQHTETALPIRHFAASTHSFSNPRSNIHSSKVTTADALLSDRTSAPSKSSILAALAAFDPDDDERDDTYDVEDVGGTVDSSIPGGDPDIDTKRKNNNNKIGQQSAPNSSTATPDENETLLFQTYKATPTLFDRDSSTRRSPAREKLKQQTGMTDEAIEGWALMLSRNPAQLRRMEARYSTFSGHQHGLGRTRWNKIDDDNDGESNPESSDVPSHRGGRGGGRGRRGGRGGRGGANVAGPSSDRDTQVARQRKEQNKGARGNHNRREGRARKMGRGFGMGPTT